MNALLELARRTIVAAGLMLAMVAVPAAAQLRFVRGQGADDGQEKALAAAKLSAWKNYLGSLQGAKLDNVLANEARLLADLESILIDVNIIDDQCKGARSGSGRCAIAIKATINESVLDSRLRQTAVATGSGKASSASDDIAFLVMARVADSQTSFETKVTKRAESTVGTSGTSASADASSSGRGGAAESSAEAVSVTQASKTVTGGSQENKRDRINYSAWPNIDDLQNRVGEALTNNRISTVPWEDLVANCGVSDNDPFSKLYASSESGQLPANTRNDIFRKLKECQLTKIIIASIEVDGYRTDPNSGLWMASGNINIQVYDITGRFGRSIGAANRAFSGRGEKLTDASRNALANAAKAASDVIVNQLNLR